MKKLVWLTGGSGSGKSLVASIMRDKGIKVIDADFVSRKVLEKNSPAYFEVLERFGKEILLDSGVIDRKALGAIVFADSKKLQALNEITHKYIKEEINKEIEGEKGTVVVDAPLPPEGFASPDFVVVVTAPEDLRIKRIIIRDNITDEYAKNRIKSQISDNEYIKRADFVIKNDGTLKELTKKVEEVIKNMEC